MINNVLKRRHFEYMTKKTHFESFRILFETGKFLRILNNLKVLEKRQQIIIITYSI